MGKTRNLWAYAVRCIALYGYGDGVAWCVIWVCFFMDACLVISGGAPRNGGGRTPALVRESFQTLLGASSAGSEWVSVRGMPRCLGMQHHAVVLWGCGLDHRFCSSCLAVLAWLQFGGKHAWSAFVLIGLHATGWGWVLLYAMRVSGGRAACVGRLRAWAPNC